ncbi:MAG: hypothetical protein JXQ99_14700 [Hyphomicrobiaceae bacterium]
MMQIVRERDVHYDVTVGSIAQPVIPSGRWLDIATFDRDHTPHNTLVICAHRLLRFVEVLRWRQHTEWFDGYELRRHEGWCFCLPSGKPVEEDAQPTHWMITPDLF